MPSTSAVSSRMSAAVEHGAGGIVRRVDDQQPRARRDRGAHLVPVDAVVRDSAAARTTATPPLNSIAGTYES